MSIVIKNNPQGSQAWLLDRIGHLTGSSAQAIATMGKGMETLAFEKAAEIMTRKLKPSFTNEDIERGNLLEEMARNAYELETGNPVKQVGFVELDQYVGCSPDGLVGDDGLVEIKCKNDVNFVKYMYEEKIDTAHIWQMQYQMYVTGREWCDYVVFNENFEQQLIIRTVQRDGRKIEEIKVGISMAIQRINEIISKVQGSKPSTVFT